LKEVDMYKGTVKKLIRDKGFGFISAVDGRDVFFHQSSLVNVDFNTLDQGQELEFEVEKSDKGPRAINVRMSK